MNRIDEMGGTPASLAHVMRSNALERPDQLAIITPSDRATYADLWSRVSSLARYLRRHDVGHGTRVGVLIENSVEWLVVAGAVASVGGITVAMSTWVERWDLERLIDAGRPEMLFLSSRVRNGDVARLVQTIIAPGGDPGIRDDRPGAGISRIIEIGPRVIDGSENFSLLVQDGLDDEVAPEALGEDIGLVLFSSGSTSAPKGVAMVNQDIVANAMEIAERLGMGSEDKIYVPMPFFWAMGGPNGMMVSLTQGATLVTHVRFDAAEALKLLEEEQCSAIYTMPNITSALLGHASFSAAAVRRLRKGVAIGNPTELEVVIEQLGVTDACNVYGSSELYANATVTPHAAPASSRLVANGPPLPGMRIRIIDPATGVAVVTGVQGEILVAGRVAAGYLGIDGNVAPIVDAEGYFHTGDIGSVDKHGWLTFHGRASEMVKTRGINVSPAEVEEFLCSHAEVDSALVFGLPDEELGETLVAMVVPKRDAQMDPDELATWARGRIASYKIPRSILVIDELPTTQTGKISRKVARTVWTTRFDQIGSE